MPNVFETADAAASPSTAYTLTVGQTAQGVLGSNGDHDWYRVDLIAGQTYTFAMTGTGTSNVRDPYLRLYGANGSTLLDEDDDSLPSHNSLFTYTATSTGAHYIDAAAYNNAGSGQYGVSVTAGSRASFDVQMGAGVIDTDISWSAQGTPATVTYGFRQSNNGGEASFSQVTPTQMAAIQAILAMYSEVCGLTFTPVNAGGYTNNATMLFSNYDANDGAGAYAYYPGSTSSASVAGDVWLNTSVSRTSLPPGSYSYSAIAHEVGHAVGLSHPGEYNAELGVLITYAADAQFVQDTHQYTIMSYFDESNTTGSYGSHPDTLMLLDIYALQQIYGANTATRSGNTVYGFNGNAGGVYDFSSNTNPALCIWDGGGIDTLDLSGFSQTQSIRLTPGMFSDIGGRTGNVSIALNCNVENVVGGSGTDRIYLTDQAINNAVNGGGGDDWVYVSYAYGNGYTVSGTAGNFSVTGSAGVDTFQSIEFFVFTGGEQIGVADLLTGLGAAGTPNNDDIVGDTDPDTINGGDGNDRIDGVGDGNVLHGDGGNDYLTSVGNDNLAYGDAGNDQLYFVGQRNQLFGGDGDDWVGVGGNNNSLAGGAGADFLGATGNANTVAGDAGNDTIRIVGSDNHIYGGNDHDSLYVSVGNSNFLYGENGNDWLGVNGHTNTLNGGSGNDWIGASGSGNTLYSGGGGDTLFAYGTNNYLYAQGGGTWVGVSGHDNFLFGADGAHDYLAATGNGNHFDPGSGNDAMVAAAGHSGDVFVFRPGYDQDSITGFAAHSLAGSDIVDLRGFGLSFPDLINQHATQVGTDTLFAFGDGDSLRLNNVQVSALQASDFLLV